MKSKTKRTRRGGEKDKCEIFQEADHTQSVGPSKMAKRRQQQQEANEYCKTKKGKTHVCPKDLTKGCVDYEELLQMRTHDLSYDGRIAEQNKYSMQQGGRRRKSRKRTYRRKKIKKSRKSRKSKKSKKSRKRKKSHKRIK